MWRPIRTANFRAHNATFYTPRQSPPGPHAALCLPGLSWWHGTCNNADVPKLFCVCVCQIKPDVMPRNTAFDQLGRLQSVCLATAVTNYLFTLNKSTLYSRQCRYTACFPLKALTRTSHRLHTQWIGTAVAHLTTAPAAWHQPHWILLSHWPGSTDRLSSHGGLPHCVISTSRRNELSYIYAKHNARIGITFCMLHYDDARNGVLVFLKKRS